MAKKDASDAILSKLIEHFPKYAPFIIKHSKSLRNKWICLFHKWTLKRKIKNATGYELPMDFEIVDSNKFETKQVGTKIYIMRDPTDPGNDNETSLMVAAANHCIPNAEKIMDKELREGVKWSVALELVESALGAEKSRSLVANRILVGGKHILKQNKYYNQLNTLREKKLLIRLYVHSLALYGHRYFNTDLDPQEIRQTIDFVTDKLASLAKDLCSKQVDYLFRQGDANYQDDFPYFFKINGYAVNLMLVRSPRLYQNNDVETYYNRADSLIPKGAKINYLICGGFDALNMSRAEYDQRRHFAKRVASRISEHGRWRLISDSEKNVFVNNIEFPVYIAIFVRSDT